MFIQVRGDKYNIIADHLSHGRIAEAKCLSAKLFNQEMEVRLV